jgi:hypothetical protein
MTSSQRTIAKMTGGDLMMTKSRLCQRFLGPLAHRVGDDKFEFLVSAFQPAEGHACHQSDFLCGAGTQRAEL